MTKHTQEPWHVSNHVDNNQVVVRSNDGDIIANLECDMVRDFMQGDPSEQIMADAHRIVTCVNACAGMDDPKAEIRSYKNAEVKWEQLMMRLVGEDGYGSVEHAIIRLKSERDEAVKALRELQRSVSDVGSPSVHYLRKFITDTLTKIGGQND